MDPFNALSCAAAVLQFVDFSFKIIGSAYEIYTSQSGASEETVRTREITERLQQLSQHIEDSTTLQGRPYKVKTNKAIIELAQHARSLADELQKTLASLSLDQSKRFQSWQIFRNALRSCLKADLINALQSRLDGLRSELMLHLIVIVRDNQSALHESIDKIEETCQSMRVDHLEHMTRLNDRLSKNISSHGDELKRLLAAIQHSVSPEELRKSLEARIRKQGNEEQQLEDAMRSSTLPDEVLNRIKLSAVQKPATAVAEIRIAEYSLIIQNLACLSVSALKTARLIRILQSLRFTEMPYRYERIHETYANTYSWIFDTGESELAVWLAKSNGLFWLKGKAGSGKSTLFKYLTDNPRTKSILRQWAAGKQLHTASFFFWNHGSMMQKSQKGLLQSLLFQVLGACPDLAEYACPQRWNEENRSELDAPSWGFSELVESLKRALTHSANNSRFCFFIDGLDEYDGYDHVELINLIRDLQDSPSVKFCVSSRPWNIFVSNYGGAPTLSLEEKTKRDMEEYICGMLTTDSRFEQLKAREDRADELATEISIRANGVFLWVFLVVRELLRGLNEDDDFSTLKMRLEAIPSDLEEYFKHMLSQLDKFYRVKSAKALLAAAAAWNAPTAEVVYGIEYGTSELHKLAIAQAKHKQRRDDLREIGRTRLNSWCRDLLQFSEYNNYDRVDFLHRTVKDFLCTKDIWSYLEKQAGSTFNPRLLLCRAFLSEAKYDVYASMKPYGGVRHWFEFQEAACQAMYYAVECEMHDDFTPFEELEELDGFGRKIPPGHWTEGIWTNGIWMHTYDFLAAAVACGLQIYVRKVLQEKPKRIFRERSTPPLIHYARANGLGGFPEIPDKEATMVELLRSQAVEYDRRYKKMHWFKWRLWGSRKVLSAQNEVQRKWERDKQDGYLRLHFQHNRENPQI